MKAHVYIGTSGWHYPDWVGLFYRPNIKGYDELKYHATHFETVENNASFYLISQETTYKTWDRMTPPEYKFSMKLNKAITHVARLELTTEVKEKVQLILESTQVLKDKLGAMVIQLPPGFKLDLIRLDLFLKYFTKEIQKQTYKFDIAIEFRHNKWFIGEVYSLLEKYNVALVAGQSSRYPEMRRVTADIAYIRMHGPEKLFASKYSREQLIEWATYINKISTTLKKIYVYFNNDFYGYAITNAKKLIELVNKNVQ